MSWLHDPPRPAPPSSPHVALEALMGAISEQERAGLATPATNYLRLMCPKPTYDKWGSPLPMTDVAQDQADRMFAVLAEPHHRLRELVRSGLLLGEEVDAVRTAFPEIYSVAVNEVLADMMDSVPPYREWAETTIGVLIGMPPSELLQSNEAPEKLMAQHEAKTKSPDATPDMSGTAADRREISVRKELR